MARIYADVNQQMPRAYWDYDSVNISWGVLENYEVVKKIGMWKQDRYEKRSFSLTSGVKAEENTLKCLKGSMSSTTRNASSKSSSQ